MAHTPGPWTRGSHGYAIVKGHGSNTARKFRRVRNGDVEVAHVWCGEADDNPLDSQPDDLMLILAAPDLLAALKRVVDLANCAMDYSGVDAEHTLKRALERISKAKRVCETAIAKAEGRA